MCLLRTEKIEFAARDWHDASTYHRHAANLSKVTQWVILFFTTTGIINERFIAAMTWEQVLPARLIGGFLMIPVGRPYGMWRDWMISHAKENRLSQLLWDSLALMSFQVPIYAAIIAFSGASGDGLIRGVLGAAVMMILLGRPYGAFLNWMSTSSVCPLEVKSQCHLTPERRGSTRPTAVTAQKRQQETLRQPKI